MDTQKEIHKRASKIQPPVELSFGGSNNVCFAYLCDKVAQEFFNRFRKAKFSPCLTKHNGTNMRHRLKVERHAPFNFSTRCRRMI